MVGVPVLILGYTVNALVLTDGTEMDSPPFNAVDHLGIRQVGDGSPFN